MSAHVRERLSAYVDRELPGSERAAVEAHLRECADCARGVDEMRTIDALARAHDVEAPEGYFEALPGRLRGRLSPRRRVRVPAWSLALAAGLAVAVIAPLTLRERPAPAPKAAETVARSVPATPAPAEPQQTAPAAAPAAPRPSAPVETKANTPRRVAGFARPAPPLGAAPPAAEPPVEPPVERQETAPAARTPATLASAEDASSAAAEEQQEDDTPLVSDDSAPPRERAGRRAAPPARPDAANARPGAGARFRSLSSRAARSAAEARALRDAWLDFVRETPDGPQADDARVRALEAGAAAWRLGGRREDRTQVEQGAREYLRRPDGAHHERVRALLAGLEP